MGTRALPDMHALSPRACSPLAYTSGKTLNRARVMTLTIIVTQKIFTNKKISQFYKMIICFHNSNTCVTKSWIW